MDSKHETSSELSSMTKKMTHLYMSIDRLDSWDQLVVYFSSQLDYFYRFHTIEKYVWSIKLKINTYDYYQSTFISQISSIIEKFSSKSNRFISRYWCVHDDQSCPEFNSWSILKISLFLSLFLSLSDIHCMLDSMRNENMMTFVQLLYVLLYTFRKYKSSKGTHIDIYVYEFES